MILSYPAKQALIRKMFLKSLSLDIIIFVIRTKLSDTFEENNLTVSPLSVFKWKFKGIELRVSFGHVSKKIVKNSHLSPVCFQVKDSNLNSFLASCHVIDILTIKPQVINVLLSEKSHQSGNIDNKRCLNSQCCHDRGNVARTVRFTKNYSKNKRILWIISFVFLNNECGSEFLLITYIALACYDNRFITYKKC